MMLYMMMNQLHSYWRIHIHSQPIVLCCFHKQVHNISVLHELPLLEDLPELLVQGLLLLVGQVSYDLIQDCVDREIVGRDE